MTVKTEIQSKIIQNKLDLLEELQRRLENRQDGFEHFETELVPREEQEYAPGALDNLGFKSLERLADLFTGFRAEDIRNLPDALRVQFRSLLERAITLLEDARHYDKVRDLARNAVTDKATFIQAANEIYEDVPEELLALLGEFEVSAPD